ncbi:MAG: DUF551 domain-containing protein [Ruminococcaceae bacterium]|nr:DUF551 domain-containing protein [Oscillospiraceae bacterium]
MTEEKVKVFGEYALPEDEVYFDKEIEEMKQKKTWIPVTKALPTPGEMVLVSCKTKSGKKSVNRAYVDEKGWWHGSGSMSGVQAWMPLPKPFEEEEI